MQNQKYNSINNENIKEMVLAFYSRILEENNDVALVFKSKLGEDLSTELWQEHITILTNFWCMIALDDDKYNGNPMMAHRDLPLSRDMFGSWLGMFFVTIDEMFEPHLGAIFKNRASNIASNFMRNMGL